MEKRERIHTRRTCDGSWSGTVQRFTLGNRIEVNPLVSTPCFEGNPEERSVNKTTQQQEMKKENINDILGINNMNNFIRTNMSILALTAMMFLFPLLCFADSNSASEFDGSAWANWTNSEKVIFLNGYISGTNKVITENSIRAFYSSAYCSSEYNAAKAKLLWLQVVDVDPKRQQIYSHQDICALLDSQIISNTNSLLKWGVYDITVGQLNEGLNHLYSNFENKNLKIDAAIYVVKKQIKGASPEEIEAILEWLRGDMKDYRKLLYTDKQGKKKYAEYP